tara:strand:- start:247 stop:594 length:348 start_codon:yes stop_codon:yes gene_type:complete
MLSVISNNNLILSNTGNTVNNITVNYLLAKIAKKPKNYFINPKTPYATPAVYNFEVHFESTHKGFFFISSAKIPAKCGYLNVQLHNGNQASLHVSQKHKLYILAQLQVIYNTVVW